MTPPTTSLNGCLYHSLDVGGLRHVGLHELRAPARTHDLMDDGLPFWPSATTTDPFPAAQRTHA